MRKEKVGSSDIWFWMGLAAVGFLLLPFLILGQDAIVVYHDQLDGEMLAYLFAARYPLADTYQQFMGGMSVTALTVPAPLCTLFFVFFSPFTAYVIMQLTGSLTGYLGMWLMGREMKAAPFVSMAVGVLFAYLPFLPVYGLSQFGVPLLIWSFYQLYCGRKKKLAVWYPLVYAMASSLVLAGFAVLAFGAAVPAIVTAHAFWVRRKQGTIPQKEKKCSLILVWLGMLLIYVAENGRLLLQMLGLGSEAVVSHKAEYLLAAEELLSGFLQNLWLGGQHSEACQKYILMAAAVTAAVFLLSFCCNSLSVEQIITRRMKLAASLFGGNVLLAGVAALWNCSAGVALRSRLSALGGFQMDRVLWLAPAVWYLLLLCILQIWWEILKTWNRKGYLQKGIYGIAGILAGSCLLLTGVAVLKESCLKPNVQKLLRPDYQALSYRDYYAEEVLVQVKEYLWEQTGQYPEEYRVVSLGIDPAAAYYAGFSCLDGYSNNYALDYKYAFRQIIAPELQKSEYLTQYYDDWGNRCYLVSAECPGYYTIEKGGFYFQQYELNAEALKAMGGRYLFSAAYILNAEEQGLKLLREEPFETNESYYRIFLYEVMP